MKLELLGFNDHFARAFEDIAQSSWVPARILSVDKYSYNVAGEFGESMSKISGSYRHTLSLQRNLPVVGDFVALQISAGDDIALIQKLLPRTTFLARKISGEIAQEQVIVANIDTVFIVVALDCNFDVRRIERCIAIVKNGGAKPVIILNKSDLLASDQEMNSFHKAIAPIVLEIPIHYVSVKKGEGLAPLHAYFTVGKTVVLFGASGVGKSSLTNYFLGASLQRVVETRLKDSKGRHTTTRRQLFVLPSGSMLIDTPGLREFQLTIEQEMLDIGFNDIESLRKHCRFRNCSHNKEPDCAVQKAIQQGQLTNARLESFQKLKRVN